MRPRVSALVVLAELAVAVTLIAAPAPASAQFFDFFGGGGRGYRGPSFPFFDQQPRYRRPAPAPAQQGDFSRAPPAPAPKTDKTAPADAKTIVVMGDSMADWLANGLEQAFTETPDIAVARKHRTYSSLIYNPGRHDPRTSVDWPVAAREILSSTPTNFVVMMIGLSDRDAIRVPATPRPVQKPGAKPGQPEPTKPGQAETAPATDQAKPAEAPAGTDAAATDQAVAAGTPAATYEFKTDKWAELYGKRIDDTIAALKSKGVPVFWVGLPPILGARSTADMQYLNDQFRSHAEKAGITYIDVWDGFADDAGRFTMQGPDYEGQTRRLRSPDGIYFTPAGARKLAHCVEREIQRALTPSGFVAIPLPEEPLPQAPAASQATGAATPRPLAGPVMPLNASVDASKSDQLLGAASPRQTIADAVATRVLVKGEPVPAPAGRADDFNWPRRSPAPVGADPVVATATLPMTPMVASSGAQQKTASAAPGTPAAAPARAAQAPVRARPRVSQYGYGYRQQNPFFFFFGR